MTLEYSILEIHQSKIGALDKLLGQLGIYATWLSSIALDKLLGQLGIYATWLSLIAYLQKQLCIFYIFYAEFLVVITYVFLLNEAIMNLLSLSAFLSIKLEDFLLYLKHISSHC